MLVVQCIFKMRCTTILLDLYHALWIHIFLNAMQFCHYDFEQLPVRCTPHREGELRFQKITSEIRLQRDPRNHAFRQNKRVRESFLHILPRL